MAFKTPLSISYYPQNRGRFSIEARGGAYSLRGDEQGTKEGRAGPSLKEEKTFPALPCDHSVDASKSLTLVGLGSNS